MSAALPSDARAHAFPVSVKGVVICDDRVLLLANERDEWELPGGKLELDETPQACVVRELAEETGLAVELGRPLAPYVYWVGGRVPVVILPFVCRAASFAGLRRSAEHRAIATFPVAALPLSSLPVGYVRAIRDAAGLPLE